MSGMRWAVAVLLLAGGTLVGSHYAAGRRAAGTEPAGAAARAEAPGQALYRQAFAAGERRDFTTAAAAFQQLLDRYPRSALAADAQYQKGLCYHAQGQYERARREFALVAQHYPDSYLAVRAAGWIEGMAARPAAPALRPAAPASPPSPAGRPGRPTPPAAPPPSPAATSSTPAATPSTEPLFYEHTTAPVLPLCGPRALQLVCRQYGRPAEVEELARLAGTQQTGTTLQGLAQAAQAKELRAQGLQVNLTQLARLPKPLIAWVGGWHYVVVTGCRGGQVQLVDPEQGVEQTLAPADFVRQWQGYVLAVEAAPLPATQS